MRRRNVTKPPTPYGTGRGASSGGGKKYRKKKFRKKGFSGTKWLWNQLCTPQILKTTSAFSKEGDGNGVRTNHVQTICSNTDVLAMITRRPTAFVNTAGSLFGEPKKLVVTNCIKTYLVQNRSNWDMHLKMYECLVRHDSDIAATDGGINNLFRSADSQTINKGYLQPAYVGATDALAFVDQNPCYTPYMSADFTGSFKILKCHSYKIGPNDYVKHTFRQKPKRFDTRYRQYYGKELIGGWTKIILFSWVGGPVDTALQTDQKQSKATCDLFLQWDVDFRFHYEPASTLQYNVGSSNQTPFGYDTRNYYDTTKATVFYTPATATVQTVAGTAAAAGHQPDDNVTQDHV
jgi:hypothetical protein